MTTNFETIRMLERGVDEIEQLRKVNAELQTKAMAFDMLRSVLGMIPERTSQGYGVDVAWQMQQHSDELRKHDVSYERFPDARSGEIRSGCGSQEDDTFIDEALAGAPQPSRPYREASAIEIEAAFERVTVRHCACPPGPCCHDPLDQRATSASYPNNGSDGDE